MSVKEKTRRLNIIISESLHEQLSELVEKHDESKSGFIRLAVVREKEKRGARTGRGRTCSFVRI